MKLLTFTLNEKNYAFPLEKAKEVIRMKKIIPVPESADFVEGVMSLRGKVIPVINLRVKMGLSKAQITRVNRIIIAGINSHFVGILVDKVSDVINLKDESIEKPDELLKDAGYLIGMGKIGGELVLIMDIEKLLSMDDKQSIESLKTRVEVMKK